MTWATFRAINKRIITFDDWTSKITLVNVLGWAGAVVTGAAAFSGGFDWAAPRVIAWITNRPELVAAWPANGHWGLKLFVYVLILALLYLAVFCFQASTLIAEQQARATEQDCRKIVSAEIGVTFTKVRDYYEVANENGDCFVIHEASFVVGDLDLSHVERKLSCSSATSRGAPVMDVPVHPPSTNPSVQADTSSGQRVYHFRFQPAIVRTATESMVRFKEDMRRGIWMWREDVPFSAVLGGQLESISHLVNEPTELLELEVLFPRGYTIAGDRNFRVRLGTTENVHAREEQRLEKLQAVDNRLQNDRQILKLTVQKPVIGLCYFLCWVPKPKPVQVSGTP
jgi:hypothetical protein